MPAAAHVQRQTSEYDLREPVTAFDWTNFHTIRKLEIFVPLGKGDNYNPNHEDDRKPRNFPLLLKAGGRAVGTARLDILPSPIIGTAAVRLVAIAHKEQGRGYGRALMQRLEWLAFTMGTSVLVLNSNKNAVDFYSKLGYLPSAWNDPSPSLDGQSLQMAKLIQLSDVTSQA